MDSFQVLVFIIVVTYGIDRILAILFGIINFFDPKDKLLIWLGSQPDPAQRPDKVANRNLGKQYLYFVASAVFTFAIIWFSKFGILISGEAIQIGNLELNSGNLLRNLDFWVTWLILTTGSDKITTLLGLSDPVGKPSEENEPIVIEGILDLKEELAQILEKIANKQL